MALHHERTKSRGVEDILIACVDGLSGFVQAIDSIFPQTEIQQCIIHQITMDITKKWTGHRLDWRQIHSQLEIYFEERLEKHAR